jgi:hypothetical protein
VSGDAGHGEAVPPYEATVPSLDSYGCTRRLSEPDEAAIACPTRLTTDFFSWRADRQSVRSDFSRTIFTNH